MDHIVYLDHKAKELVNLRIGRKTMIIRGAMGRKLPYGRIEVDDTLYFIENIGDCLVKAKAIVQNVFCSGQLSREESMQLVDSFAHQLQLDSGLKKRFRGKRYLTLITIKDFQNVGPFKIERPEFSIMEDWIPLIEINLQLIK